MSNRGNQDYFKIQGTRTGDADIAGMAHRRFTQELAAERRKPHVPTGPQAMPVHIHLPVELKHDAPPVHHEPRVEPTPNGEETARSAWRPPSLAEATRVVVGGARELAGWALETSLRAAREVVERRIDRAMDLGRSVERYVERTAHGILDRVRPHHDQTPPSAAPAGQADSLASPAETTPAAEKEAAPMNPVGGAKSSRRKRNAKRVEH